jgi:hypothetical protein
MRVSVAAVFLIVILGDLSCVTKKAQLTGAPQATPANVRPPAGNENVIPDNGTAVRTDEPTQDQGWLSYEPAVVELRGKLITKMYYGPPNFGEHPKTDSKETPPILALSHPINVRGNPDSDIEYDRISVKHIQRVELVLTLPHKNMMGKNVIVSGTLFHAFTGHHHTDVLMEVQSIRLAN